MNINEIIIKQKEFFNTGKTLDIKFRKENLKKLAENQAFSRLSDAGFPI